MDIRAATIGTKFICVNGHFDLDRMLACMQDRWSRAGGGRLPFTRVMGHAEWLQATGPVTISSNTSAG